LQTSSLPQQPNILPPLLHQIRPFQPSHQTSNESYSVDEIVHRSQSSLDIQHDITTLNPVGFGGKFTNSSTQRNAIVYSTKTDREAWTQICEISRNEFNRVYQRLGVQLEEKGESLYNPYIPNILNKLTSINLVEESQGARVIFLEGFNIPLIVFDNIFLY
ncbi:hypothetical protein CMV_018057, partial [Castanea mollissima]